MPPPNQRARARKGDPLTPREQEILGLLAAGNSPPDIAARLGIALGTARTHVARIYMKIGAKPDRADENNPLTRREQEILALLAAGNSTPDIAEQLGVTPGTVKTHLTSVYRKIGVKNRIQATLYYIEHYDAASDEPGPAS